MDPANPRPPAADVLTQPEFEFITELCTVVAEQSELQPILEWLVHKATRLLGTEECTIKLLPPGGSDLAKTVVTTRRGPEAGASSWPGAIKEAVMGYLAFAPGELVTPDFAQDARFPGLHGGTASVRALIAAPLRVEGRLTGMIAASESRPGRQWSRHDVQLMSILASHSGIVVEKARLRMDKEAKARLEVEKEAMDKELRVAHDIQMKLVPETALRCGPWMLDGRLVPARQVGGDFYDYFEIGPRRPVMVIADVAGKGVPAALLVSTVQSALRAYAGLRLAPRALVEHLNRRVAQSVSSGRFVTLFYAELDPELGRLRYVNAGHVFPRIRRADGGMESLPAGGVPLGIFEDWTYEEGECQLEPGDSMLMYSDGIPDAANALFQDFGEGRVESLWRKLGAGTAREALDRLFSAVSGFQGSTPQTDDQTALVLCPDERA